MSINFPAVAEAVILASKAKLAEDLKTWDGEENQGMRDMFTEDHNDTLVVAGYIAAGKTDRANTKIMNMDTAARDEVGVIIAKVSRDYYETYLIPNGWVDFDRLFRFK